MTKEHCKKHPDVEMVTVTFSYCPACRGSKGGKVSAKNMTAKARSERARKAALARVAKEK